jgi:hypothetical protein
MSERNDEPASDHERWAESEAQFCDLMVETMLQSAKDWHDRGVARYGASNAQMAAECMIRADAWGQMADNLRKSRRCRIEYEQYDRRALATPADPA